MLPGVQAAEVCRAGERCPTSETSLWADQGWLVLLAGLVCLLHVLKDLGWHWVKRLITKEDTLKVKIMSENASLPIKGSPDAAGWDLAASVAVDLQPGERRLVPLGISVELPRGCYGRIASRSSWASRGVDVARGVIDADYRGEIKVILVNNGDETRALNSPGRPGRSAYCGKDSRGPCCHFFLAVLYYEGGVGFWQHWSWSSNNLIIYQD